MEIEQGSSAGAGGSITVTDGTTTVPSATEIFFVGAVVTNGGGGVADVSITGGASGITSINTDTTAAQVLAVGTSGTDFAIANNGTGTHTFNLPTASVTNRGALSSTDWSTFNNKQAALTIGNLTDAGTDGITITGGTGSVIGTGTSIAQHVADTTHNGYLSSTDWNTFNGKGSGTVTSVAIASTNGFAGSSSGGATPTLTLSTSITGLLKGNGTAISAAIANTDFQSPISLTTTGTSGAATFISNTINIPNYTAAPGGLNAQIQYNNAGAFGGISGATTNGTIVSLTNPLLGGATLTTSSVNGVTLVNGGTSTLYLSQDGTYSTPAGGGGTGTVTSVSVTTANGVSGTVATATTTPAITLVLGAITPTTVNGITLSGSGSIANSGTSSLTGFTGSGTTSGTNTGDQTITLTGDVTGSGTGSFATTLATVNTNTGSWGTATQSPQFTVNGKGLITAATNVTITPAVGSITGLATGMATFLATPSSANLAATVTDETGSGSLVFGTSPSLTGATLDTTTVGVTQTAGDSSTKLATTAFVANAILGQDFKEAAKYATTGALPSIVYNNGSSGVGATLTGVGFGAISIDSSTPSVGDRLLVKNQVSTFQNGIYIVTTVGTVASVFVLTRSTDFNQGTEIDTGDSVFVSSGSTLSTTTWAYNGVDNPTMGTTAITFAQTAGQGSFTAGNGIAITGVSIAIDTSVTVDKTTAQTLTNKNLTSGTNTFPTFNQNTTGSAATLTTPRAINGVNFDGSAAITVTAAAGTLTGTVLNSAVVTSSLTSLGTLGTLTVTGNIANSVLTASKVVFTDASKNLTSTGIGSSSQFIKADGSLDSSTYITGNQTVTLSGVVTGSGATAITTSFGTFTSATLATALSDETGTGVAVFGTSPTFTTSILAAASTANIGSTTTGWAHLYMTTGGVLDFGNGNVVLTHTSGILSMGTGELRITTVGTNAASVPTLQSTSTLTSKRITRRFIAVTQAAAPAIATDNTDIASITGLAQAVTSFTTNLTGTPVAGDYLMVQITDNGTARALTWGAKFTATTIALPTTTVISKLLRVGFQWDTVAAVWQCIAVA